MIKHGNSGPVVISPPLRGRRGQKTESGYWEMDINSQYHWRDIVWINDPDIASFERNRTFASSFFGSGRGFSFFQEMPTPRFRVGYKDATKLGDACYYRGSTWLLLSSRLAKLLQEIQPDGVEILPVEVELKGGAMVPAGEFVMLDVTLRLPIFDCAAMKLEVVRERGHTFYEPTLGPPYILRNDIPSSAKLFRDSIRPTSIFAADAVKEACRSHGLGRRLRWRAPAN